jgi:hypothetical protein
MVKGNWLEWTPSVHRRRPLQLPSTSTRRSGCFPAKPYPPVEYPQYSSRLLVVLEVLHEALSRLQAFCLAPRESLSACPQVYRLVLHSQSNCEAAGCCSDRQSQRRHAWLPQATEPTASLLVTKNVLTRRVTSLPRHWISISSQPGLSFARLARLTMFFPYLRGRPRRPDLRLGGRSYKQARSG